MGRNSFMLSRSRMDGSGRTKHLQNLCHGKEASPDRKPKKTVAKVCFVGEQLLEGEERNRKLQNSTSKKMFLQQSEEDMESDKRRGEIDEYEEKGRH